MAVRRVLHLAGSAVSDFLADLSLLYARDCWESVADAMRYEMHVAVVTPDGRWCFPEDLGATAIAAAETMTISDAITHIVTLGLDVVVPQMFCLPGMTSYRALFDVLRIPFVGNPPDVMALGAHKARAKSVVAGAGVLVPPAELLRPGDQPTMPPPVVVKPVDGDNSLGISLVRAASEYDAALSAAFAQSDQALVESYIELGREVRCGIVVRDGELVPLPLEEYDVDRRTKPIRDHDDKIGRDGDGGLRLAAKEKTRAWIVDPSDPITQRVWDIAKKCHLALGCRQYSLFDFRIDPDGQPWFLEAGLYCSFARQSVISVMAAATGLTVRELFHDAIEEAIG